MSARKQPRRKARSKKRTKRRQSDPARRWALIGLGVIVVLGIIGTISFDDRHWHAFDDAGDAAFERGNYAYAERMYDEALQVARELKDEKLIAESLRDLNRVYAARARR